MQSKTKQELLNEPRDLIVFGEDWGGLPSSTQHLISHLSKDRRILWVNSIGLRQPEFTVKDVKRAFKKIFFDSYISGKRNKDFYTHTPSGNISDIRENNNFIVVNPKTIPAPKSPISRWISRLLLLLQIKPILRKMKLQSPILWISLPTAVDFCGYLGESSLVYYCGDDFKSLSGVDHDTVSKRELETLKKASLVMTSSKTLLKDFPKDKTIFLPHGVDFDLFSNPTQIADDLPKDGKPIAGFYGSISKWFDIDTLKKVINYLPTWNFVFIGKVEVDISSISSLSNTYFLGPKDHQSLPTYSQHWTVSLLPFVNNKQIDACNPLKLREYLATGTPIVSTNFSAIHEYKNVVKIVNNSYDMVDAIEDSFFDNNKEIRKMSVSNQTWTFRSKQVSTWLSNL